MILSVDAGVKVAGAAAWNDGKLVSAWLARGKTWYETAFQLMKDTTFIPDILVIEVPQIYSEHKLTGDPNDLIDVALMAGAVQGLFASFECPLQVVCYRPGQWKGQVPKAIMGRRILARLSEAEKATIESCPESMRHNAIDAAGIGLKYLHRL